MVSMIHPRENYGSDEEMLTSTVREPLCEIQHRQMDSVQACNEMANLILRLLTDNETLIGKEEPKTVLDEAEIVLNKLQALMTTLTDIKNAIT